MFLGMMHLMVQFTVNFRCICFVKQVGAKVAAAVTERYGLHYF